LLASADEGDQDLRALLAAGKARTAGPEPVRAAAGVEPGGPVEVEVERTVNPVVGLGFRISSADSLAGVTRFGQAAT
jgi:hypothetical protein